MNIEGKRIIIRAIEIGDLGKFHEWFNNPDLVHGFGDIHFPSSLRQQEVWFEKIQTEEETVRLAVQHIDGVLIGFSGFWHIHWRDRRAEHAVMIGDDAYRDQGYGREVIASCARYAFKEMGLFRLDATVLKTNGASLKAYQACGFEIEGTLRGHALRGGRRIDRIMLGLLLSEYKAWEKRTGYWDQPEAKL